MKFLYTDKQGNKCAAKLAFTLTIATCLGKILIASYTKDSIDYSGMSTLIAAVGAIYWGRSNTKAASK